MSAPGCGQRSAVGYERAGHSDRAGRLWRSAPVLAPVSALSPPTSARMVSMLGPMSQNVGCPAEYASDIDAARERLVAFVDGCTDEQWTAAPLEGDPRPVGMVVDHVAHSYEYLAGWISQLLAGKKGMGDAGRVGARHAPHAGPATPGAPPHGPEVHPPSGAAPS